MDDWNSPRESLSFPDKRLAGIRGVFREGENRARLIRDQQSRGCWNRTGWKEGKEGEGREALISAPGERVKARFVPGYAHKSVDI